MRNTRRHTRRVLAGHSICFNGSACRCDWHQALRATLLLRPAAPAQHDQCSPQQVQLVAARRG